MERLTSYASEQTQTPQRKQEIDSSFLHNNYLVRRKLWSFGTKFDVLDENKNFLFRAKKELFRFTRRFHLYGDKDQSRELLAFATRGSIPQTYDIVDAEGKNKIGVIRHNIPNSFLRTTWDILTPDGDKLGTLRRMRIKQAWNRRGPKTLFYPMYEIVTPDEKEVAVIQRRVSLFGQKYNVEITDPQTAIDRRILMAANIIIAERDLERQRAAEGSAIAVSSQSSQ